MISQSDGTFVEALARTLWGDFLLSFLQQAAPFTIDIGTELRLDLELT
jgi:hypothetical protein